jgi:MFS family permease
MMNHTGTSADDSQADGEGRGDVARGEAAKLPKDLEVVDNNASQPDEASEEGIAIATAIATPKEAITDIDRPAHILPLIVASQFAGTSLWFAGNAVLPELIVDWEDQNNGDSIPESAGGYLTSVVQLGFIVGTLASALMNLADRFRPTQVFLWSSLIGAVLNALIPFWKSTVGLVFLRFGTGIALAGIYPVGTKVAADWYPSGLGRALGWLVGALAVGSAIPFLLKQINQPWEALMWETSGLAALGGLTVGIIVPDGPFRKAGTKMDPSVVWTLFRDNRPFRGAAFGYFGHMWELYAFWTYMPVVWGAYIQTQGSIASWDASAVTFVVLAIGGLGCVIGGLLSDKYCSAWVAFVSLAVSGLLCLLSPALFLAPPAIMVIAYLIWGLAVVADSPQFSSLVATTVPATNKGTALTIVNSIGFAITIGSIQLLGVPLSEQYLYLLLAPGPVFGLWCLRWHVFPERCLVSKSIRASGDDSKDEKECTTSNEEVVGASDTKAT